VSDPVSDPVFPVGPAVAMTNDFEIDRCVCFNLRFAELQQKLDGRPSNMDQIAKRFGCGSCCGLCRPYIERMLETGETVFAEVLHPNDTEPSADGSARRG
jgi:bacterioferritin-associated ferredoxin